MANINDRVIEASGDIGHIYGLAGYYSECEKMQHVVVATTDGRLHELHWNWRIHPFSYSPLLSSPGSAPVQFSDNQGRNRIHSLSGFYTSDDHFQHVIIATGDRALHEVYFTDPQHVNLRSPLVQLPAPAGDHIGQAGFYDFGADLRTVIVGGANYVLYEVAWNAGVAPSPSYLLNLSTLSQSTHPEVAAIAGFYDLSFLSEGVPFVSKNVIVAMKNGEIYDVRSEGTSPGGGSTTTEFVTRFSPPLVNEAAFVETETHCRHVIALQANGQLYDYSYTPEQVSGQAQTPLVRIDNVVDIVGYYSAYDSTCHVIAGTSEANGKLHDVSYNLRQ